MSLTSGIAYLLHQLEATFLSPGSTFSLTSLACALVIALGYFALKRRRRKRAIRVRTLARALFPKRITGSKSHAVDVGYFFLNTLVFGLILGWAMLSYQVVGKAVSGQLASAFGTPGPAALPELAARGVITLALFLAYELAYWVDHYLSHRIGVLWEFHKIHHQATVLTPLTMFRIHPVDGLVHANITAVVMGVANGAAAWSLGRAVPEYAIADGNLLFVLCIHAYVQLQHSHVWIAWRGLAGRVLMSPAHHQIHHSADPVHYNKNLGSCLALWDWLFGTLHIPAKEDEKLTFGVVEPAVEGQRPRNVHSLARGLFEPFLKAFAPLALVFQHVPDDPKDAGSAQGSSPAAGAPTELQRPG